MSNKKKRNRKAAPGTESELSDASVNQTNVSNPAEEGQSLINKAEDSNLNAVQGNFARILSYLRTHLLLVGIICLVAFGALGSALKYLDEDAQREIARRNASKGRLNSKEESFLNKINPFLPNPDPTPPPQLSKEYIYAGSRLLAVEDANANVAPPADLAIWRPDTGYWWVMKPDGNVQASVGWGQSGDDPVEGDYDGDGKTDFSVYRPATSSTSGTWWIMRSSDNSYFSTPLGGVDDITAQADYDGDGRTDAALFRPSTGVWYILQSSDGQTVQGQFGQNGDIPAPADYDGDGKADIAVWRNSDMKFYSRNSSNGVIQQPVSLGQSGEPVPGDYDGDGRANFALRNGANWVIMDSSLTQFQTTAWQSGARAVQNDYDGDGKVDIAVWNAGTWYIRNSADNSTRTVQWGMVGDIPVPAYYRH